MLAEFAEPIDISTTALRTRTASRRPVSVANDNARRAVRGREGGSPTAALDQLEHRINSIAFGVACGHSDTAKEVPPYETESSSNPAKAANSPPELAQLNHIRMKVGQMRTRPLAQ